MVRQHGNMLVWLRPSFTNEGVQTLFFDKATGRVPKIWCLGTRLQPGQLTWLHIHGLSFTPKSWTKLLAFMSSVYAWPAYLKLNPSVEAQISATRASTSFTCLCFGSPILYSDSSPPLASSTCFTSIFWNIWICSFKIYTPSKQASIDTHAHAQCSHVSVGLAQARPKYPTFFNSYFWYTECCNWN